jgi:hypothetical protein
MNFDTEKLVKEIRNNTGFIVLMTTFLLICLFMIECRLKDISESLATKQAIEAVAQPCEEGGV